MSDPHATAPTAHRKYTFDNEFEGGQAPSGGGPYKRLFNGEEVEALTAKARVEGEAQAMRSVEAQTAAALADLAQAAKTALPALAIAAHEHRAGAAELALACGRQIADAACERFPEAPLQAALAALAREVEATPRLTLRAPPALLERLQAALTETAEAIGYPGQILARADPALPPAAFRLDWGDGAAAFDPAAAARRVAEALEGALASEGLHAESLALPTSDSETDMADSDLKLDEFGPSGLPSTGEGEEKTAHDLAPVFDVPVNISAVLGRAHLSVAQLLQLGQGSVLELDRKVGEAIDIYVNNRLVARGEVVVVEDRLGVTMTEIIKDGDAAV